MTEMPKVVDQCPHSRSCWSLSCVHQASIAFQHLQMCTLEGIFRSTLRDAVAVIGLVVSFTMWEKGSQIWHEYLATGFTKQSISLSNALVSTMRQMEKKALSAFYVAHL